MKFLMCVGAEKAGTTWLYEYFVSHPDYIDIGKELNIIQRDDLVPCLENVNSFRKDLNTFFKTINSLNDVTGDFTHYEGSSENIYRIIRDGLLEYGIEIVPVYIMRDPIRRAWAAWNMLGGGKTDMSTASKFVMSNLLSCKYKETIQALDNVFDNPRYFFYETFFKQSNINTICDDLNISRMPAELCTVINAHTLNKTITEDFIKMFGKSQKNIDAIKFIAKRFDNIPWELNDYA